MYVIHDTALLSKGGVTRRLRHFGIFLKAGFPSLLVTMLKPSEGVASTRGCGTYRCGTARHILPACLLSCGFSWDRVKARNDKSIRCRAIYLVSLSGAGRARRAMAAEGGRG